MKSVVPSSSYSGKRRWRGLVIAVLGLVILSMLVPLVFLLGLHNGFHSPSGYIYDQKTSPSTQNAIQRYDVGHNRNRSKGQKSNHVQDLITKFEPTLPQARKFIRKKCGECSLTGKRRIRNPPKLKVINTSEQ